MDKFTAAQPHFAASTFDGGTTFVAIDRVNGDGVPFLTENRIELILRDGVDIQQATELAEKLNELVQWFGVTKRD